MVPHPAPTPQKTRAHLAGTLGTSCTSKMTLLTSEEDIWAFGWDVMPLSPSSPTPEASYQVMNNSPATRRCNTILSNLLKTLIAEGNRITPHLNRERCNEFNLPLIFAVTTSIPTLLCIPSAPANTKFQCHVLFSSFTPRGRFLSVISAPTHLRLIKGSS